MYFTLQVICYLKIYDIPIPGNADIYVVEFTKLIEFDVLNPDGIIRMFNDDPNFKLLDWVQGKSSFNSDGSASIMDELRLYIMGAAVGLVFLVGMMILALLKRFQAKMIALAKNLYNKMIFNGMIRSITIVYIKFCVTFG